MNGGYFAPPAATLDPALFESGRLRPEVSSHITTTLANWFSRQGYLIDQGDLHIWLAGSGISYQWGNGDLDVFFAFDALAFSSWNSWWLGFSARDIAAGLNEELRETLWPEEADVRFSSSSYHLTYFCIFANLYE